MSKKRIKKLNFILITLIILSSTILFNNKTIEKEIKKKEKKNSLKKGIKWKIIIH